MIVRLWGWLTRARYVYRTNPDDPVFGAREWPTRYDSIDRQMGRPIHGRMSVAPPHAKRVRVPRRADS